MKITRTIACALTACTVMLAAAASAQTESNGSGNKQGSGTAPSTITVEGTILSKTGNTVKFQLKNESTILPAKNSQGTLSKYFESNALGFTTTGWMDIGKMKVVNADRALFTLEIVQQLSTIVKDGKEVDQFKVGATCKYTW